MKKVKVTRNISGDKWRVVDYVNGQPFTNQFNNEKIRLENAKICDGYVVGDLIENWVLDGENSRIIQHDDGRWTYECGHGFVIKDWEETVMFFTDTYLGMTITRKR